MAPPAPRWLRREVFVGLALGQFVSLLITSTGFSSSELARRGVNAPTSQSLLNYVLLALVYGGILIYRRQQMTIKWYYFLILGIVDVEANYIEGPNPLKGDLFVIAGAMLYAVSNVTEILPFIGFAICGATMLNLSLLTSDMWAVLIRIFAYHEKVDWMYFVAFAGTAAGLVIYSYK
uniref:Solute carrier family 35 member F1-like n=1 Tax=Oryza punctata TaxID=4537 RepID=A0A0E0M3B0_ORYPU